MILIDTQFFGGRGGSSGSKGSGKAGGGSARISNSFPSGSQANAMAEYLENAGYKVSVARWDDENERIVNDYIGNNVNLIAEREIRVPYKDFKNEKLTGEDYTPLTRNNSSGVSEVKGSYDASTKTIALKETLVISTSVNPKYPVKGDKTEFVENKIKSKAVNKPYLLNAIKYKK